MNQIPFSISLFLTSLILVACGKPVSPDTDITAYVTTNDRQLDFSKETLGFDRVKRDSAFTITIDPDKRFQTLDGFGAAVTGSTCYNLLQMRSEDRAQFLKETFSDRDGMGQSYVRISIGCSDFSLSEYTCCDQPGIENFSLQEEENKYVIPVLKEILAIHPELKILGSPWTCPPWMKVNNLSELKPFDSWTSGQLNPAYYADYAQYFVKWIQDMEERGVPIYAITPQNEPLNRGNSASLYMGWEEQRRFIKENLGPALREAGLETKIYVFDHNYNYDNIADQNAYPLRIYADSTAGAYVTGAAYHNYGGDKNELLKIQAERPDKELIFTETSIGTWNDGRNLALRLMEDMEEVGLGTINNGCKAVIVWNLMLDSERGPNREGGCQTCYGAVDIDRADYKTITRNSHYYVIGHLASVVKPGATRIGAEAEADSLVYSAFENTDGTYALVLLNKSVAPKRITVQDGKRAFTYPVPPKAVASFRWEK